MTKTIVTFLCTCALALVGCATATAGTLAGQTQAADPVNNVVLPFFDAVAREDLEAAQIFMTPDTRVEAMFNANGQNGTANIRSFPAAVYFQIVARNYENIVFSNRVFSVADDGQTVWMEAQGELIVAATGQPYKNGYVFKLTIADGRITRLQEWVNTVTLTQQGIVARPTGQ
jgi:ketosteroid isomerase-like protein